MKTWLLQTNEAPTADFMATSIQSRVGAEAVVLAQKSEIGALEWAINSSLELTKLMEHHQDAVRYHKGNKKFWFDGGVNGEITTRRFVAYGNGTRTDFTLPYRWIYAPSLVMSVNYATNTAWTLKGPTIRFTSAPAMDAMIHIERCKLRYKCFFIVESDRVYQMTDNFKHFASRNIKIREFTH